MSKLDKFFAKPVEVTIGNEQFMLKPFTVEDLPLLTRAGSKDESISMKATQEIVFKVLKQIDPEAKEEDMKNVAVEYIQDIMSAVMKVNNLPEDIASKTAIEKLKERNESR